jgi:hypothetical protein
MLMFAAQFNRVSTGNLSVNAAMENDENKV